VYGGWLAIVRVVTGCIWLAHGISKFTQSASFMPPNGTIVMYVQRGLQTAGPAYHGFLVGVVQPNLALFAELVRLGEVLVGISLVLGVLSRVGGFFGIVLTLNYIAARGHMFSSSALQSNDFALLTLSFISLVLPTGRVLGVDALFGKRAPRVETVRAEFVPEPPRQGPSAPPKEG
jgi:thiosulfate dehydrogenase [quinone] large subunit